jgi:tripartite-type tricarboxylate transporter receptor subunit TctC
MMRRRALAAGGLGLLAAPALGQPGWPMRPLRLVVPFGLGGSADVAARFLAEPLASALGQPVVVENRPGGGGTIGTDAAAKATDGHTILMMSNTQTANETLIPNRPYVLLRDLRPVAAVNIAFHVLAVHPALAARNVPELIALARARPGELDYASSGPGTPYHIAGEVFAAMAGIRLNHIPYRGSNEARTALVAGQVALMFDAIPTMRELIAGGRVRGLATTGPARAALLPELPVVADSVPGFQANIWLGLMAPAGLPEAAVARLHGEVIRILERPETRAAQARAGAEPLPMSVADFSEFLQRDIALQREAIRLARIELG